MSSGLGSMPRERRLRIRRGEPIRECGLDWFPVTMDHYEDFIQCRDALSLRLSSLPVRYMGMDYLSAVFALELAAIKNPDAPGRGGGLFFRLMRLVGLSLRIEMTSKRINESIYYRVSGRDDIAIDSMTFEQTGADGETLTAKITPFQFSSQIRPLLAAQNQIELPDEADNSDLIADYDKKRKIESRGISLKTDLDDLVSAVAYKSGVADAEIMKWNVRDFENRRRAIERDTKYRLYAGAELGGMVSFKHGNPYPSWCFDAADDTLGTLEFTELSKTLQGAGAAPGSMPN